MKITLKVNRYTTDSELIHLGNFFTALGINRGGKVFAAPTDPAELDEGDVTFIHPSQAHDLRNGEIGTVDTGVKIIEPEAPKRRRRTKAEIEAEADEAEATRIAEAEAEAQRSNEAGLAEATAGNEQPAATQTATVTDTGSAGTEAAASEPAAESPSERPVPTHATLNMKATAVAKKIGPDKIKAKIGELGGKLISTLSPEALVEFDSWLDAQ